MADQMIGSIKVVVTGMGVISSAGVGIEPLRCALQEGRATASDLTGASFARFPLKYACQIHGFNPLDYIKFKFARHMTRSSQLGCAAALLAVQDTGLDLSGINHERIQIFEGTSIGGLDYIFSDYEIFLKDGYEKMNPTTAGQAFIGSTTGEISILLGLQCRGVTVCSGSASSNDAIGLGFEQIKAGAADIVIVGGAEAPIIPGVIASFCRAGVVSNRADGSQMSPRAFTIDRDGFIPGEGAGFLVLENEKSAKARHAKIYAELAGFGNSCDAYQMLAPHPEGDGVIRAADRAIKSAGIQIGDVDYINAHGTGTKLNDKFETIALRKIFGKYISEVRVSSTKPITGHLLGASGAIEAIACILAITHSFAPPLINYYSPDPECDLRFVVNKSESRNISCAMSFNYGFGGKNSVLIFKKINS